MLYFEVRGYIKSFRLRGHFFFFFFGVCVLVLVRVHPVKRYVHFTHETILPGARGFTSSDNRSR